MGSIFDRILNIRPQGLPATVENVARVDSTPGDFRSTFVGITGLPVHPTNPYKPNVGGSGVTPTIPLNGQFVPPNRRSRHPTRLLASPGLHLDTALAPGQYVRLGIKHPGRPLGRTGNPNKRVGS
jgi:hypothetical protein